MTISLYVGLTNGKFREELTVDGGHIDATPLEGGCHRGGELVIAHWIGPGRVSRLWVRPGYEARGRVLADQFDAYAKREQDEWMSNDDDRDRRNWAKRNAIPEDNVKIYNVYSRKIKKFVNHLKIDEKDAEWDCEQVFATSGAGAIYMFREEYRLWEWDYEVKAFEKITTHQKDPDDGWEERWEAAVKADGAAT